MATYLRKFQTRAELDSAKIQGTLDCPNTALIMADGSVVYTPTLINGDVGIRGANGVCYTLAEWNALAAADKPTPVGAYYYDDTTAKGFVIHGTVNNSVQWSSDTSVQIPGVTTTTSGAQAILDFAGVANTQAVLDAVAGGTIPNAPVFTWARSLDFVDSNLVGYVGGAGEMNTIRINLASINACRAAIGQSEIVFSGVYFWSSTQYSAYYAWAWDGSQWNYHYKNYNRRGLALAAF